MAPAPAAAAAAVLAVQRQQAMLEPPDLRVALEPQRSQAAAPGAAAPPLRVLAARPQLGLEAEVEEPSTTQVTTAAVAGPARSRSRTPRPPPPLALSSRCRRYSAPLAGEVEHGFRAQLPGPLATAAARRSAHRLRIGRWLALPHRFSHAHARLPGVAAAQLPGADRRLRTLAADRALGLDGLHLLLPEVQHPARAAARPRSLPA